MSARWDSARCVAGVPNRPPVYGPRVRIATLLLMAGCWGALGCVVSPAPPPGEMQPAASSAEAPAVPLAVTAQGWKVYRVPGVQVWSRASARRVGEVLESVQLLRAVVLRLTNTSTVDAVVPTRIFLFRRDSGFRVFEKGDWAGKFLAGARQNHVIMQPSKRRVDAEQLMLHEYTHFLMNNAKDVLYPRWYSEGYAELLSTVHRDGDRVVVGAMPRYRGWLLANKRWLPLEEVVSTRKFEDWSEHRISMFYAQAWGLVQFLHFGRGLGGAQTGAQMHAYLRAIEAGESVATAFAGAFGATISETERELRRYLRREVRGLRIPLAELARDNATPQVRQLSPARALRALGELALRIGRPPVAESLFAAALRESPEDPRALAGLADAHKFQRRWKRAGALFSEALALAPDDPLLQLDFAEYLHEAALYHFPVDERPERLREARRHYVRSQTLDSDVPETYMMYGRTFLVEGEEAAQGLDTLEHAHQMLPSYYWAKYYLARGYALTGDVDRARTIVDRMAASRHVGGEAAHKERADALFCRISSAEPER